MHTLRLSRQLRERGMIRGTRCISKGLMMRTQPRHSHTHSVLDTSAQQVSVTNETNSNSSRSHPRRFPSRKVMILVSMACASLGFGYHFCDRVPITNRWRLIWPNAEFDGAVGYAETWESTPERPILKKEAPEVATIQKILNRILDTDRMRGLVINLFVCEVLG